MDTINRNRSGKERRMSDSIFFRDESIVEDILAWSKQKRDTESNWYLFDKVLYDLCKQYPRHNNPHEIVAKIALIGRAYSASVERRRNAKTQRDHDFYYEYIAPQPHHENRSGMPYCRKCLCLHSKSPALFHRPGRGKNICRPLPVSQLRFRRSGAGGRIFCAGIRDTGL